MRFNLIEKKSDLPQYTAVLSERELNIDTPSNLGENCVILTDKDKIAYVLVTRDFINIGFDKSITIALRDIGMSPKLFESNSEFIELIKSESATGSITGDDRSDAQKKFREYVQKGLDMLASDIHFQVNEHDGEVKYRVDGDLELVYQLPAQTIKRFLDTFYTSFSSDLQETGYTENAPLSSTAEGAFTLNLPYVKTGNDFKPHQVKARVRKQSDPLQDGKIDEVWRIIVIDEKNEIPSYRELGYLDDQIEIFERCSNASRGLTIICGTTGSGKSLSLASLLNEIVKKSEGKKNVRTVENPVEYVIPGARQKSISNPGLYAESIRVQMRMDPDVLSIGEIIDKESAYAAADFCLSGHLSFATLHAGTPMSAVKRLENYGVDALTLSEKDFLNCIVIQTLIKKLCQHCCVDFNESDESKNKVIAEEVRQSGIDTENIKGQGKGCDKCNGKGTLSRQVIANVVEITPLMRSLFGEGKIKEAFETHNKSILTHAIYLLNKGIVSPISVFRSCASLTDEYSQVDRNE